MNLTTDNQNSSTTEVVKRLDPTEARIVACSERFWWEKKRLPTSSEISDLLKLPLNLVRRTCESEIFERAMEKRGIPLVPSEELSPKQMLLATSLLNVLDTRTIRAKLKDLGITPVQYSAWMAEPAFAEFIKKRAFENFSQADAAVLQSLIREATNGEMKAIELFLEMRGLYTKRVQVEVNVNVVINSVIDVIVKHVKDPQILEAIAHDIEEVQNKIGPMGNPLGLQA